MLPLLLALLLGAPPAPATPSPPHLKSQAFGLPVEIEVRDLSVAAAREAVQQAFVEVTEMERLTASGLAALNAGAGKGPRAVDPRLLSLLSRAESFCEWSEGAHGPLGRDLYAAWGLRSPVTEPPDAERVGQAAGRTACSRLSLDPQRGTATLAEGSALDLVGFAEGAALDRAVEILRQRQAVNGFIRIGPVQRGFGPGPAGKGWPAELPRFPGQEEPVGVVYLRDQSLAVASQTDHPLQGGSASYVNQRTGQPATGAMAAAVVAELALDAQGLATTLLITGPREGQLRMGTLDPRPSVRWFLGGGEGEPILVDYRWAELNRR